MNITIVAHEICDGKDFKLTTTLDEMENLVVDKSSFSEIKAIMKLEMEALKKIHK